MSLAGTVLAESGGMSRCGAVHPAPMRAVHRQKGPPKPVGLPLLCRRVFCNRSLNMKSIAAVGFDMDYTLAQVGVWWGGRACGLPC